MSLFHIVGLSLIKRPPMTVQFQYLTRGNPCVPVSVYLFMRATVFVLSFRDFLGSFVWLIRINTAHNTMREDWR